MLIERWRRPSMLSSMCQHVARLQFDCCGVRFHGKSFSLAQKEVLYSLNLIHEFTSLFPSKVNFAGLPGKAFPRKHAFVDISVFLWLRKQWPRFAQGQPKGYFQTKELHRTIKAICQMNADWKVGKAQYAEFNVPTCGKIAVWQLYRETQPLWNSHDSWWPELNMFGSMPWCSFPRQKLLPSWRKRIVIRESEFDPWVYILVFAEGNICRFA